MSDIQSELASLQKEIDQVRKRRADLLADIAQTTKGIVEQRQALGGEMLAGRAADKGLDTLAREAVRIDALQEAVSQADDEIRRLDQRFIDKERAAVQVVFDRVKAETHDLVLTGVSRLCELQAAIDAMDTKFIELAAAGGSYIQQIENIGEVRRMMNVRNMLRNVMVGGTVQSGAVVLKTFKEDYQEFVPQVQAKK